MRRLLRHALLVAAALSSNPIAAVVADDTAAVDGAPAVGRPADSGGPVPHDVLRSGGNRVTLWYGEVGGGFRFGVDGGDRLPAGFEVAGPDGRFVPAEARRGWRSTLHVFSDAVAEPTRVRYGTGATAEEANVFGGTGLPAEPFDRAVQPRDPPEPATDGSLWLPAVFGDHMVVTEEFRIWGRAEPGAVVRVSAWPLAGRKSRGARDATATILDESERAEEASPAPAPRGSGYSPRADAEGRWSVAFEPGVLADVKDPDGRVEIEVGSGEETVVFTDVLVGDVWLCSGQSNMEWSLDWLHMGDKSAYGEQLDDHEGHELRFFAVENALAAAPAEDVRGRWVVCDAESADDFSAVGYHFGIATAEATGRPVGLIAADWGGSPVEFWTPEPTLRALGKFSATAASHPKPHWRAPRGYNAMIAPLTPLRPTGVIWYQGESNASGPEQYAETFGAMIAAWREAFAAPELPFVFAQLTGFDVPDERAAHGRWPDLRAAQAEVASTLPAAGMAVTYDVGDATNIHPHDKATVGKRLALQARKVAYGEDVVADGPVPAEVTFDGDIVRIRFANAAGGLRDDCPSGCGTVVGFELAGEAGVWREADATVVTTDTLELDAFDVPEPTAVRYAWADFPGEANLYGGTGLPAWPFERAR